MAKTRNRRRTLRRRKGGQTKKPTWWRETKAKYLGQKGRAHWERMDPNDKSEAALWKLVSDSDGKILVKDYNFIMDDIGEKIDKVQELEKVYDFDKGYIFDKKFGRDEAERRKREAERRKYDREEEEKLAKMTPERRENYLKWLNYLRQQPHKEVFDDMPEPRYVPR